MSALRSEMERCAGDDRKLSGQSAKEDEILSSAILGEGQSARRSYSADGNH